jgi:DNA-binding protein HU-beta
MALTQTQLAGEVAERSGLSKTDAKAALAALEEVVLEQLAGAEKVRIGGVVQLVVRVKEATKPRKGRNPATGEEITISAKPAAVALRARPLAKAKAALPSVQKARKRLAAGGVGVRPGRDSPPPGPQSVSGSRDQNSSRLPSGS